MASDTALLIQQKDTEMKKEKEHLLAAMNLMTAEHQEETATHEAKHKGETATHEAKHQEMKERNHVQKEIYSLRMASIVSIKGSLHRRRCASVLQQQARSLRQSMLKMKKNHEESVSELKIQHAFVLNEKMNEMKSERNEMKSERNEMKNIVNEKDQMIENIQKGRKNDLTKYTDNIAKMKTIHSETLIDNDYEKDEIRIKMNNAMQKQLEKQSLLNEKQLSIENQKCRDLRLRYNILETENKLVLKDIYILKMEKSRQILKDYFHKKDEQNKCKRIAKEWMKRYQQLIIQQNLMKNELINEYEQQMEKKIIQMEMNFDEIYQKQNVMNDQRFTKLNQIHQEENVKHHHKENIVREELLKKMLDRHVQEMYEQSTNHRERVSELEDQLNESRDHLIECHLKEKSKTKNIQTLEELKKEIYQKYNLVNEKYLIEKDMNERLKNENIQLLSKMEHLSSNTKMIIETHEKNVNEKVNRLHQSKEDIMKRHRTEMNDLRQTQKESLLNSTLKCNSEQIHEKVLLMNERDKLIIQITKMKNVQYHSKADQQKIIQKMNELREEKNMCCEEINNVRRKNYLLQNNTRKKRQHNYEMIIDEIDQNGVLVLGNGNGNGNGNVQDRKKEEKNELRVIIIQLKKELYQMKQEKEEIELLLMIKEEEEEEEEQQQQNKHTFKIIAKKNKEVQEVQSSQQKDNQEQKVHANEITSLKEMLQKEVLQKEQEKEIEHEKTRFLQLDETMTLQHLVTPTNNNNTSFTVGRRQKDESSQMMMNNNTVTNDFVVDSSSSSSSSFSTSFATKDMENSRIRRTMETISKEKRRLEKSLIWYQGDNEKLKRTNQKYVQEITSLSETLKNQNNNNKNNNKNSRKSDVKKSHSSHLTESKEYQNQILYMKKKHIQEMKIELEKCILRSEKRHLKEKDILNENINIVTNEKDQIHEKNQILQTQLSTYKHKCTSLQKTLSEMELSLKLKIENILENNEIDQISNEKKYKENINSLNEKNTLEINQIETKYSVLILEMKNVHQKDLFNMEKSKHEHILDLQKMEIQIERFTSLLHIEKEKKKEKIIMLKEKENELLKIQNETDLYISEHVKKDEIVYEQREQELRREKTILMEELNNVSIFFWDNFFLDNFF